ncbi:hypothetical protein HDU67_008686 [Dinochytrium kinnereticum]|nr:hypothetical protein HDU67_008686 [Dinochytrium kinnereticum]
MRIISWTCPTVVASYSLKELFPSTNGPWLLVTSTLSTLPPTLLSILLVYALLETLWSLLQLYTASHHASTPGTPPPYTSLPTLPSTTLLQSVATFTSPGRPLAIHRKRDAHLSAMNLFRRVQAEVTDFEAFLSEWFLGRRVEELGVDDVGVWLAWAFFGKEVGGLSEAERRDLEVMAAEVQRELGVSLQAGSSGAKCLRHTLDPMKVQHRPLATKAMDYAASLYLHSLNFTLHVTPNTHHTYWHLPPRRSPPSSLPPILFVHGIGAGLVIYLPLIRTLLARFPTRHILLLELRHVSMQLNSRVPSMEQTLESVQSVFDHVGTDQAVWIGHSLGSVVCSWVCRERPEWVSRVVFVDPVVFGLWNHHVAFNFLYRDPRGGLELLMWFWVSQEMNIAVTLRRHFWWYRAVLFPEYLPPVSVSSSSTQRRSLTHPSPSSSSPTSSSTLHQTLGNTATRLSSTSCAQATRSCLMEVEETPFNATVFLSRNDHIVPYEHVVEHLRFHHVRTVTWDGFGHGQCCVDSKAWDMVCDEVERG